MACQAQEDFISNNDYVNTLAWATVAGGIGVSAHIISRVFKLPKWSSGALIILFGVIAVFIAAGIILIYRGGQPATKDEPILGWIALFLPMLLAFTVVLVDSYQVANKKVE
jgi:hypothetical protein